MAFRDWLSRATNAIANVFGGGVDPEDVEPVEEYPEDEYYTPEYPEPTGPYETEEPAYYEPEDEPYTYGGLAPDPPYYFSQDAYQEALYVDPASNSAEMEWNFLVGQMGLQDDPTAMELIWEGWFGQGSADDRMAAREYLYDYEGWGHGDEDPFLWDDWRTWYGGTAA